MSWHLTVISLFIVSVTIFTAAQFHDEGAWWYVVILLLGIIIAFDRKSEQKFAEKLYEIGFPRQ